MDIWPGSSLSLEGVTFDGPIPARTPDPLVLALLIAAGLLLLVNYSRLLAAVRGSAACYRGINATYETLGNNYLSSSIQRVFLLLLPFYALAFSITGLSTAGYWWTLLAIVSFALLRKGVFALLGWMTSHETALRGAEKAGWALAIPMLLVSSVLLLFYTRFPNAPNYLWWCILAFVAGVYSLFCAIRVRAIILHTGFSFFYWVLYICALEILPICVVVKILMNGY